MRLTKRELYRELNVFKFHRNNRISRLMENKCLYLIYWSLGRQVYLAAFVRYQNVEYINEVKEKYKNWIDEYYTNKEKI